jgi:acyl-CoA thioester hydrolase
MGSFLYCTSIGKTMKPPELNLADVTALPLMLRLTIPAEYRDENGHMNMRWYLAIYDDAGYPLVDSFGLTSEYHAANSTGGFDLEHHLHYIAEVHVGDTVAVHVRLVGRTAKRMHYLFFMVNETRGVLASIFECVNSFADLKTRRTAPWPQEIADRIDVMLNAHTALPWPAPTCGVISA